MKYRGRGRYIIVAKFNFKEVLYIIARAMLERHLRIIMVKSDISL